MPSVLFFQDGGFYYVQEENALEIGNKAVSYHMDGYNCAQSVLAAAGEYTCLEESAALAISAGFGGGLRCGEVCGAVSGAVMALGLCFPFSDCEDSEAKAKIAALAAEYCSEFKECFGGIRCADIVGDRSHCSKYISAAAEVLEKFIKNNKEK